jgi:hypothetical protein
MAASEEAVAGIVGEGKTAEVLTPVETQKRQAMLRLVRADTSMLDIASQTQQAEGIAYLTALKRARMGGLRKDVTVEGIPAG